MASDKTTTGEVVVRCRIAGVHIGTLASRDAHTLVLTNARRLWRWRGANTLNEVVERGVNRTEYTRISEPVSEITLTVPDTGEVLKVRDGVDLSPVWNED